jgi:ribosome-associated translation inhibitor RaiA
MGQLKSYLTPKQAVTSTETVRRIPVDGPVGVFRRDNGRYDIVLETTDETIDLDIQDAAVSRKNGDNAPVLFSPDPQGLRIQNQTSKNAVSIKTRLGEQHVDQGEDIVVSDDCLIELGITTELRAAVEQQQNTLSVEELKEKLGMQQQGDVLQGVSPSAHVRAIAVNLRKASNESVSECRKYATELKNFVAEHEVADSDYEPVFEDLQQVTARLETKSSGTLRGSGMDAEWQEEIDVIADRVEKLYSRAQT